MTDRIARSRSGAPPEQAPLVVAQPVKTALALAAMNDAAARLGLRTGMALADAKAMYPTLAVADAGPEADRILLEAIADWCDRYTPLVGLDPPDGLILDITGCAHLFGGEAAFCADIVQRLGRQGLAARAAIADTVGCACAVARFGANFSPPPQRAIACDRHEGTAVQTPSPRSPSGRSRPSTTGYGEGRGEGVPQAQTRGEAPSPGASRRPLPASGERWRMRHRSATCDCPAVAGRGKQASYAIVPPGGVREALLPLRLAALRIAPDIEAALGQAGLKCITDVIDRPRAPLAARFGADFIRRIDQAVGRDDEPITPRLPVPSYVAERRFAEPILLEADVLRTTELLAQELARMLERRGEGARRLQVALFRTDGKVHRSEVGTGAPLRDPARMRTLFAERLAAVGEACDPGFGFDVVRLSALATERCDPVQTGLAAPDHAAELAHLVDRLGARFGLRRVTRPVPQDSHIPEFAVAAVAAHCDRPRPFIPAQKPARKLSNDPHPLVLAEAGTQSFPQPGQSWVPGSAPVQETSISIRGSVSEGILRSDRIPAYERVKELPHPLIPADAGIQTLPNCTDVYGAKAGSPRPRGRAGGETRPSSVSFTGTCAGMSGDGDSFTSSPEEIQADSLCPPRPIRLFGRPEPIEAIAEVPDGPPVRFRWRRVLHQVAHAEGPERIAMEWWRDQNGRALTRDYFRVESREGVRVWLYREGLYGRELMEPRWFLHGLFA